MRLQTGKSAKAQRTKGQRKAAVSRWTLLPMLARPEDTQSVSGKIKTAADFVLSIPCEPAKGPDKIVPLLLVETNDLGGPERGVYQCQECTRIFYTRTAWRKHKGIGVIVGPEIRACV